MIPATKAQAMPLWLDCPWAIPEGVTVHKQGTLVAFCAAGVAVGVSFPPFDPKNLGAVLARLPAAAPPSPGPV